MAGQLCSRVASKPPRGMPDSFATLHAWVAFYLNHSNVLDGGCKFGSLASEIINTHPDIWGEPAAMRDQLAVRFGR